MDTEFLGLFKKGAERVPFLRIQMWGGNTFIQVRNMGARTFFEVEKVGVETFSDLLNKRLTVFFSK